MSMTKKQAEEAGQHLKDEELKPSSLRAAFPNFNEMGIFNPGFTKVEYATVHFIAAHLQSHGKYPTRDQVLALAALAVQTIDFAVPQAAAENYAGHDNA